LNCKMRLLWF